MVRRVAVCYDVVVCMGGIVGRGLAGGLGGRGGKAHRCRIFIGAPSYNLYSFRNIGGIGYS